MTICHYDWFKKQADWSIADQDKARQESQTGNDRMRKGGVKRDVSQKPRKQDG